jgi:hypothetical protein
MRGSKRRRPEAHEAFCGNKNRRPKPIGGFAVNQMRARSADSAFRGFVKTLRGSIETFCGSRRLDGLALSEFRFCCPPCEANGSTEDREWVNGNVPLMTITHRHPAGIREAFWSQWEKAKETYPGITMAGECIWPVEAGFVAACVSQDIRARNWEGPYPFHEIASIMLAAGMDPMAKYERYASELPAHEPLADARLSARLLNTALRRLSGADAVESLGEFQECPACASKPGSPPLCESCLHNRLLISVLKRDVLTMKIQSLKP